MKQRLGPFVLGRPCRYLSVASLAGVSVFVATSLGFAQGWTPDLRKLQTSPEVKPPPPTFGGEAGLGSDFSLRGKCPEPKDQGTDNSCVGWTLGFGLLSVLLEHKNPPFSPYYVYRWALELKEYRTDDRWGDTGVDFPDGFQALNSQGSCDFGSPPFTFLGSVPNIRQIVFKPIQTDWVEQGRKNRIVLYYRKLSQERIVERLRRILFEDKKPIPCGFRISKGLRQGQGLEQVPSKGKACLLSKQPESDPEMDPLHAMLVVGYNDNFVAPGKGAFEVMNSFGPDFADNGFLWISYDLMGDLGKDPISRQDNPCLLVAYDYTWHRPTDSLSNDFEEGRTTAWLRLLDKKGEANARVDSPSGTKVAQVQKNETVVVTQPVRALVGFNATGKEASSAPAVKALSSGDRVIVEDLKVLSSDGGKSKEYWAEVRAAALR